MAQGTITLYQEFSKSIGDGRIDLDTHTFKVAFVSVAAGTTPVIASAAVPCWGAGGTTNVSSSEVSAGGGYTAGGAALTTPTYTQSGGTATFDDGAASITWTSAASGDPTNIKTAVIYDDGATNKDCIGFIDMTSDGGTTPISLLAGDITLTWNASGIFTLS